jgi:3-hydroxyisobutyrate dehydrogenase
MASDSGNKTKRIGFLGLGAMGLPMAVNLIRSGFSVCGYDIRSDAVEVLRSAGGKGAASACEAAAQADLLIVMVATSDQVDAVLFGDTGAVSRLPAETTVVLNSTVSPVYVRSLENRLSRSRHALLDAPVSGGTGGAEEGSLTVMAAGSVSAYQAAAPALQAVASHVYHLGKEPGIGSTVKMINQLLVGVHSAVTAEAMALGVRAGIDPRVLYEVISNSAGASFVFNKRAPQMINGDYTTKAALDIFVKDLGIVLEAAKSLTFPTPLAAAAFQLFVMGSSAGFGKEGDPALVKVYEKLTGITVAKD